jgi:hypothetical protein
VVVVVVVVTGAAEEPVPPEQPAAKRQAVVRNSRDSARTAVRGSLTSNFRGRLFSKWGTRIGSWVSLILLGWVGIAGGGL